MYVSKIMQKDAFSIEKLKSWDFCYESFYSKCTTKYR